MPGPPFAECALDTVAQLRAVLPAELVFVFFSLLCYVRDAFLQFTVISSFLTVSVILFCHHKNVGAECLLHACPLCI